MKPQQKRNAVYAVLGVLTLVVIVALGVKLYRDKGTLNTTGELSTASKEQLKEEVSDTKHVFGAYVVRISKSSKDNPILWSGSTNPEFKRITENFLKTTGGTGVGAQYFEPTTGNSNLISQAISKGQIACDRIENSALPAAIPEITKYAKTVCFGPLPPFDTDSREIIIVLLDVPKESLNAQVLRKEILRIQLEVYHREYLNQEIWFEKVINPPGVKS